MWTHASLDSRGIREEGETKRLISSVIIFITINTISEYNVPYGMLFEKKVGMMLSCRRAPTLLVEDEGSAGGIGTSCPNT